MLGMRALNAWCERLRRKVRGNSIIWKVWRELVLLARESINHLRINER